MSSYDEIIAELRGITKDDDSDNDHTKTSTQRRPTPASAATSAAQATEAKSDLERQPLLNHRSPARPELNALPSTISEHQPNHIATAPVDDDASRKKADTSSKDTWAANMSGSMFFTLSTIYGATSVALGAFGAHGLKKRIADPGRIANWSTAAQYQLIHSLALLATSIALPHRAQRIPGTLFLTGMTLFSGSIYLLVLDPARFKFLGPVTPIGGLCLIGGWIGLGVVGRRFVR